MGLRLKFLAGMLAAMCIGFAGCGGSEPEEVPEQAAEVQTDPAEAEEPGFSFNAQSDEGSVSINATGESFEIKSGDGASMQFGGNAKLPENMPDDVPTHPNMNLLGVTNSPSESAIMYQAEIKEPVSDVADYYSKEAESEGWDEQMNMNQGANVAMRNYSKDDRVLNIVVNGSDEGSVVTITTTEQ